MERTARNRRLSAACLIALAFAGCRSAGAAEGDVMDQAALVPASDMFTLVLFRTSEVPPELTAERKRELSRQHAAFIEEQAEAGNLLVSGTFGIDKADEDLRGLLLLDVADAAQALEVMGNDPWLQASVCRQEAFSFVTLDIVRSLPAMEQVRQEQRAAAGENMDEPDLRAYVILTTEEGEGAVSVLGHPALAPRVILFGRLGPPRDGGMLCLLSVESAREARALLAVANEAGIKFEVSEWYATPTLALIAELVEPEPDAPSKPNER